MRSTGGPSLDNADPDYTKLVVQVKRNDLCVSKTINGQHGLKAQEPLSEYDMSYMFISNSHAD